MILWRLFRSGPVIIVVEVERDLESLFFVLSYRRSQMSFSKHNDVKGIRLRRHEGIALFLGFRRYVLMSSDLPYALVS